MSECLVVPLEDVLAMDANNAWSRHVEIYNALGGTFRTVVTTTWDRDEAKRWMRGERVQCDLLMDKGTSILTDHAWKVHCVHEVMAMGWPLGLYLDTDQFKTCWLGVTTMLLSHRVKRPPGYPHVRRHASGTTWWPSSMTSGWCGWPTVGGRSQRWWSSGRVAGSGRC